MHTKNVGFSRSFLLPTAVSLACALPIGAQTLVKDMHPGFEAIDTSGDPGPVLELGGIGLFAARGAEGRELWRTNGTAGGTLLVRDIALGADSDPEDLTLLLGEVYFSAFTPEGGRELWKSNGTEQGTGPVVDIVPGPTGSAPLDLYAWNGRLYFTAETPALGRELWSTDGSLTGTKLVADIEPGPMSSLPGAFGEHAGTLYFAATRADIGREFWRTDGTASGTWLVEDIVPGSLWSAPEEFLSALGSLFFVANGRVWISDGSAAGSHPVTFTPSGGVQPSELTLYGSHVYYSASHPNAGRELMRTDGTEAGTAVVVDLAPGRTDSNPAHLTLSNGLLHFWTGQDDTDQELWSTDGTAAGTQLVDHLDVTGRPAGMLPFQDRLVVEVDSVVGPQIWATDNAGQVEFVHHDSVLGNVRAGAQRVWFNGKDASERELWSSDGTLLGSSQVFDIDTPGKFNDSSPRDLARAAGRLFFTADDGVHGRELWVSDGTEAGTQLAADLHPGPTGSTLSRITGFGDRALFYAKYPERSLWISDGTATGTTQLSEFENLVVRAIEVAGDWALVDVEDETSTQPSVQKMWVTDGTAAGTFALDMLPEDSSPSFVVVNGHGYLSVSNELWRTDGTLAGTVELGSFDHVGDLLLSGSTLFFRAATPAFGSEPWKSDGTLTGTTIVSDLTPGPASTAFDFADAVPFKDGVMFAVAMPDTGHEPWYSDGTAAGTALISDLTPGPDGGTGSFVALSEDKVLFSHTLDSAPFPFFPRQLWRTDGTAAGTYPVPGFPEDLDDGVTAGGFAYYPGPSDFWVQSTTGLWITDGESTVSYPDLKMDFFVTFHPIGSGSVILFAATDAEHGYEPWIADGSVPTAELLSDIQPGPGTSILGLDYFTRVGNRVYFRASGELGDELYSLPLGQLGTYAAEPFGLGSLGSNGLVPALSLSGQPSLGSAMHLELENALPSAPAIRIYSLGQTHLQVGPGAVLYTAPPLFLSGTVTDTDGHAQLSATLGSSPNLVGVTLTVQFVSGDAGGAFGGIGSLSNALEVVIGP